MHRIDKCIILLYSRLLKLTDEQDFAQHVLRVGLLEKADPPPPHDWVIFRPWVPYRVRH
jgi:hypothetical protein